MTIDEKSNIIKQIMSDCDVAIVITLGATHSEKGTVMEHEVSNEDSV
jgi:hypothetical protein